MRWRVPVVVGTTGLSAGDLAEIEREVESNDIPVLVAPNFAMGAVLMMQFARQAGRALPRACEIVELHHDDKLDAPSGTSRLTRVQVEEAWREAGSEKEVPIHSVRLPGSRGSPGGHLRRPGGDAHHPARLSVAGIVHARRPHGGQAACVACKDSSSVWRTSYRTCLFARRF